MVMHADQPTWIESKANPWFKQLRQTALDNARYKSSGLIWVEGDHLVHAALQRGLQPEFVVVSQAALASHPKQWQGSWPLKVLANALFDQISQLPSATQVAALFKRPAPQGISSHHPTVVLDRIQDVGNVGSILRSAAAFGFRQIIALKGTAALWGPKAVRAGMGAHFALDLHEDVEPSRLVELQGLPRLATSSHGGQALLKSGFKLPWPCAWFMGNEGQGLAADLEASCTLKVRIDQPGGQESLNVASAAAICLFASSLSR
jgi:TrmH family RNA methyltransferase